MRKLFLNLFAGIALALTSQVATANNDYRDGADGNPSAGAMAFDLIFVRPLGLAATVLGTGLFVLQLPLSLVQGEVPSQPAKRFIEEPAKFTFSRPLGVLD